jgi:hypothetical protein
MKFAIISDTHDNMSNFKKAISWIQKENIQLILHCGDVTSIETLNNAKKLFGERIEFVKGNGDFDLDLPEKKEIKIDKKKIAFTHFPQIAKKLAESGKFDLVFYGHTHKPWQEKIGDCRMINPGELAGQILKPTFAIYNTDQDFLELKILENLK